MRILLLLACACSTSEKKSAMSGQPPPAADVGTWKGTWERTYPPNMPGGGAMTLNVSASGLGTITSEGSLCITPDTPITIAIDGTNVHMQVKSGETTADYTATISGTEMAGTATVTCKPGTGKAKFKLTKS